jgi:hypothetical protein
MMRKIETEKKKKIERKKKKMLCLVAFEFNKYVRVSDCSV